MYRIDVHWLDESLSNKNDRIHKNKVQEIKWSDEYWQYRVAANITEYHILSKLIFLRIINPKFMEKRQLSNVKIVFNKNDNIHKNEVQHIRWSKE